MFAKMMGNQPLRRDLVEMAVKFLVTVGVHDGRAEEVPAEDKVKFLKDKGLTDAEIREAQRMVRSERACMVVVLVHVLVLCLVLFIALALALTRVGSVTSQFYVHSRMSHCELLSRVSFSTPTSQTRRSR